MIALELLGMALRAHVFHQVDDETFATAREDRALEAGGVLTELQVAAEGYRDVGEDEAAALEGHGLHREQIEVIRGSMAKMKAGERSTAGEKEPALACKERLEDVALERSELARCRRGHGGASLR